MSGTTVYAGGAFTSIGGQSRNYIAALDASTGLATAWNTGVSPIGGGASEAGEVLSVAVAGATVYAGGNFTSVNGKSGLGFAALRPDAGAPTVELLSAFDSSPLLIGSQCQISWSAVDDLAVQSVDLYLSRTGLSGPWELLAAAAPNTGGHIWTATGPEVTGSNAYLRVDARDYSGNLGTDTGGGGFRILRSLLDAGSEDAVAHFALAAPAPSPAVGRSLVRFAVPTITQVRITVLDVQGREVAVLADGMREPGRYTAALEATSLHPGIYFVRMQAGSTKLSRRVVVIQ